MDDNTVMNTNHSPNPSVPDHVEAPAELTPEQVQIVRRAKAGRKKINFAISVASFNGWSLGIFAALSGVFTVFSPSLLGVFITAGLAWTSYAEFKGRGLLKQLDTRAARVLGYNQIVLGGVIVVYCVWNLVALFTGPGQYDQVIQENPELAQALGDVGDLVEWIMGAVYVTVIALTVPYQAMMAWYYFSRAKHIDEYVKKTPVWVTQIQRAAA